MRKITQKEVIEFADTYNFDVLDKYINIKNKMRFQCKICETIFFKSFDVFKQNHNCSICNNLKSRVIYTIETIKDFCSQHNFELIGAEWDKGVNSSIQLQCKKCNNKFKRKFNVFKNNPTCPECRDNPLKFSYEQVKKFIEIESNSGCKFLETEKSYKEKRKIEPRMACCKFNIKCKCGNDFKVSFNTFKSGWKRQCNQCSYTIFGKKSRHTYDEVKNYIEIESGSGCKLLSTEYLENHSPLHIQCSCGNDFHRALAEFKGRKLFKCQKCTGAKIPYTTEQIKEELYNNNIELLSEYISFHKKIKVKYNCGYITERTIPNIRKSKYKCPHCNKSGYKRNTEIFKQEIFEIADGEYSLLSNYINMNSSVTMKHNICGNEWQITPHNFLDGECRCPKCNISKGENKIKEYLDSNNISYIPQKTFKGLKGVGNRLLSYDFYLPQNNLLIEFQGKFHDGTAKLQTDKQFKKQQEHDRRKLEYADKNSIRLLEIWYWDSDKIQAILDNIL